jgi:transposase-like protein
MPEEIIPASQQIITQEPDADDDNTKQTVKSVLHAVRGTGPWAILGEQSSSFGNMSVVARRLGVHRNTMTAYRKRWKSVDKALAEESKVFIDHVENRAREMIDEGNTALVIFTLKAHPEAKARGWGERQELTGRGGGPVETANIDYGSLSVSQLQRIVAGESVTDVLASE